MLKLTYSEDNFSLEHLETSLETWVNQRVALSLQLGTNIHIQSSTAAFLVPANWKSIDDLEGLALTNQIEICPGDAEFIEVILRGTWITSKAESETGVFVTQLQPNVELLLQEMQQKTICQV